MLKKDFRDLQVVVQPANFFKPTYMNCPNCNAKITCGCQKRTASNGKTVCTNCVSIYEQQLKTQQAYLQLL